MKQKNLQIYFFITLFVLFNQLDLYSQSNENTTQVGISASFQRGQVDILIPIKFSSMVIAPIFGIVSFSEVATDFHLGLKERFYFNSSNTRPYFGLVQLLYILAPDGGETITDYAFGIAMGGEHFFDESFSIGIEGQLNISISDNESIRFGTPGKTNLNTYGAVFASIYF